MGVVLFETIFDSTVSHSAAGLEGAISTGAFQFSVPVETLLSGFQQAFLLGAIISILIIIASLISKETPDADESDYIEDLEDLENLNHIENINLESGNISKK
jgi:hypothetical protein